MCLERDQALILFLVFICILIAIALVAATVLVVRWIDGLRDLGLHSFRPNFDSLLSARQARRPSELFPSTAAARLPMPEVPAVAPPAAPIAAAPSSPLPDLLDLVLRARRPAPPNDRAVPSTTLAHSFERPQDFAPVAQGTQPPAADAPCWICGRRLSDGDHRHG